MYQLCLLFMKFILFSMIGYVTEMITCAIVDKKIANRGFFCGPIIPIYGVGSLLLIFLLKPFRHNLLLVIIFSMLITTSIEYLTGYLLEKIFHNKWWDYSKEKFNLHGRICLKNVILFGIGGPIILYIDPFMTDFLIQFKNQYLIIVAIIIFVIFTLDVIYSCIVERMLNVRLKGVKKFPKRLLKAFPTIWKSYPKEFEIMKKIEEKKKSEKKKKKRK